MTRSPLLLLRLVACAAIPALAGLDALPPAYRFQEHRFAEPADSGHCGGTANAAARLGKVYFAQTHVMEPGWPLFFLAGNRPALVSVALAGQGVSPDLKLTARVDGVVVGQACLSGPAQIPVPAASDTPSFASRYSMTLPSAWVRPGLSVTLSTGIDSVAFTAQQMNVSSPTELNLLMVDMDVLQYNDGKQDPPVPATFLANFAASMPASVTRLGRLPARMAFDRMVFAGAADEPVLACRDDVVDRTGCASYAAIGGMDQLAAVLRFTSALSRATGTYSYGFTYGNSKYLAPGGWGGGKNFSGADFTGIFLHEMGHALGLPHWGEGSFGNATPNDDNFVYPYAGVGNNGGGRGQTWNYEPNTREFLSPLCQDKGNSLFGKERSDAMQRSSYCIEWRKTGKGPWDGFGDFSGRAIHEFLNGNQGAPSATVPYFGQNPAYHMPARSGFPALQLDGAGKRILVRGTTQPQQKEDFENYDFLRPAEWNTPVYTIYGTYHPRYQNSNLLYRPMSYVGTLPKLLDPTDPKVFADLKAGGKGPYGGYFYWEHDVSLRFTYADGTQRVAIYPYDAVSRNWSVAHHPWRWDLLYFAISIPADKPLAKVEVFHRPFVVRGSSDTTSGNIANPGFKITPQNFLDGATLMSERTFTDVKPPAGVVGKPLDLAGMERLGGQVTVRGLDGRVAKRFELAPSEGLEAQVRQKMVQPGVWMVQLRTTSGAFARTIAIQ